MNEYILFVNSHKVIYHSSVLCNV